MPHRITKIFYIMLVLYRWLRKADKKYKANEIAEILPDTNISEILIDGYSEDEMNQYRKKASEYDGKAAYIQEYYFIGFGVKSSIKFETAAEISEKYKNFPDDLQFDYKYNNGYEKRFNTIYSTLKAKDQLQGDNVDIIGAVVYGTPEELQKLKSNLI